MRAKPTPEQVNVARRLMNAAEQALAKEVISGLSRRATLSC